MQDAFVSVQTAALSSFFGSEQKVAMPADLPSPGAEPRCTRHRAPAFPHGAARVRFLSLHAPSGPTLARALHPLDESQGLSSLVLVTLINYFMLLMFVLSPLLLPLLIPAVSDLQSLLFVQSVQARERRGVSLRRGQPGQVAIIRLLPLLDQQR